MPDPRQWPSPPGAKKGLGQAAVHGPRWPRDYASRAEAMQLLAVRQQTLYAYVSRGWVRSVAQPGQKEKLYLRADLVRLNMRSMARSGHGAVAASAMNWGEPIFPSSITEITPDGPCYRGHLAAELVRQGVAFEVVVDLLWTGELNPAAPMWPVRKATAELGSLTQLLQSGDTGGNVLETFAAVVLTLGFGRGSAAVRLSGGQTLPAAREIMHALAECCGLLGPGKRRVRMKPGESIAQLLMRALQVPVNTANRTALDAMLILLADHELSPGTLGARVVASAGGTLHSCLACALCATSGLEVGSIYHRVQDLLGSRGRTPALMQRVRRLLAQGQQVPGFDHPLYPKGDPRAAQLLDIMRSRQDLSAESRAILRFIDKVCLETGMLPRQELALVFMARAMGMPRNLPPVLFVLARMAGWVAHVQEQRSSGTLLRPRAKYVDAANPDTAGSAPVT